RGLSWNPRAVGTSANAIKPISLGDNALRAAARGRCSCPFREAASHSAWCSFLLASEDDATMPISHQGARVGKAARVLGAIMILSTVCFQPSKVHGAESVCFGR